MIGETKKKPATVIQLNSIYYQQKKNEEEEEKKKKKKKKGINAISFMSLALF